MAIQGTEYSRPWQAWTAGPESKINMLIADIWAVANILVPGTDLESVFPACRLMW